MTKMILLSAIALSIMSTTAVANPGWGPRPGPGWGPRPGPGPDGGASALAFSLGALFGSTLQSCSDNYDCKQIIAAQDDAATFVATDGEVRSAALDEAIGAIRAAGADDSLSDMDIALAIVDAQ